jgi:hypothetical protein
MVNDALLEKWSWSQETIQWRASSLIFRIRNRVWKVFDRNNYSWEYRIVKSWDLPEEIEKTLLESFSLEEIRTLNGMWWIRNLKNIFAPKELESQELIEFFKKAIFLKMTLENDYLSIGIVEFVDTNILQKHTIDVQDYTQLYNQYCERFKSIFEGHVDIRWRKIWPMDMFDQVMIAYGYETWIPILDQLINSHEQVTGIFPQLKDYIYVYMKNCIWDDKTLRTAEEIQSFTDFFILSQKLSSLPQMLKNLVSFKILGWKGSFGHAESVSFRTESENDFTIAWNYKIVYNDIMKWMILSNSSELKEFLGVLEILSNTEIDSLADEYADLMRVLYRMRTWTCLNSIADVQKVFSTTAWVEAWIRKEVLWWKSTTELLHEMKNGAQEKTERSKYFVESNQIEHSWSWAVRGDSYRYFPQYLNTWVADKKLHGIWSDISVSNLVGWDLYSLWVNTYRVNWSLNTELLEWVDFWDGIVLICNIEQSWIQETKYAWKRQSLELTEVLSSNSKAMIQYIIRDVLPSSQIDAVVLKTDFFDTYWSEWVESLKRTIANQWFYIPIYTSDFQLLFDYDEFLIYSEGKSQ